MKPYKIIPAVVWAAYGLLWCGGAISYLFWDGPPAGSGWTAPAFLFVAALLAFYLSSAGRRGQLALAAIIGMAAEFSGLMWGFPFGPYSYTGVLFPSVFGVPIAIGCAWLILFAYVQQMLARFAIPGWLRPVVGAFWLTALDLVIDPVAAGPLKFWIWPDGGFYYGIPASNFAGWLITGCILFLIFRHSPQTNMGLVYLGSSVLLFFTLIAARQMMVGPMIAGAFLVGDSVFFGARKISEKSGLLP